VRGECEIHQIVTPGSPPPLDEMPQFKMGFWVSDVALQNGICRIGSLCSNVKSAELPGATAPQADCSRTKPNELFALDMCSSDPISQNELDCSLSEMCIRKCVNFTL
jgi:hypothetical protein